MKITLRLVTSLIIVNTFVAGFFSYVQYRSERNRLQRDLAARVSLLAESVGESLDTLSDGKDAAKYRRSLSNYSKRDGSLSVWLYRTNGEIFAQSRSDFKAPDPLKPNGDEVPPDPRFDQINGRRHYIYFTSVSLPGREQGIMALSYDAHYIDRRLEGIWRHNFLRFLILSILILLTTLLVIRWSITGPIAQAADWIMHLRLGESRQFPESLRGDLLGPLGKEVSQMAKSLQAARAAAEKEAQLRLSGESVWTPEKLKEHVRSRLGEKTLYLVSNREPYMHVRKKREIECIVPASGMVTALEPVMRATGGTWIAHGSGDADREVCDSNSRVQVPPADPAYSLKRVWLSKEEEDGHYYGFSNEGLWPLCHITHQRPVFRLSDWIQYQNVNSKFADALLEEIGDEEAPLVLIQDYHFALLPHLIRQKRPKARIALFWHIPWPNPESFGICPWKQEILMGMMAADIVGFHTQFHCNNFLDTIDNTMECKISWENFTAERGGHSALVRPFPISVAVSSDEEISKSLSKLPEGRDVLKASLLKDAGITAKYLGVGVDRLDYTKGILERFRAVERFLEKYPRFVGEFTFVQLGAPSRTHIQKYHDFIGEVEKTAEAINWKFQTKNWKPIVLLKAHHSHSDIFPYYRAADLCMVTSLHDGMNLVAKEFVSARSDHAGVLILSQFTGASRELRDALIVNPYDIEVMAEAIYGAIEMPLSEQSRRMEQMRKVVQDKNVYRWAASIITAMSQLSIFPDQGALTERPEGPRDEARA